MRPLIGIVFLFLVLIQLLNLNRISLFIIGLAIDFLPGPIAVYQFFLLGYGWKRFLLCIKNFKDDYYYECLMLPITNEL